MTKQELQTFCKWTRNNAPSKMAYPKYTYTLQGLSDWIVYWSIEKYGGVATSNRIFIVKNKKQLAQNYYNSIRKLPLTEICFPIV